MFGLPETNSLFLTYGYTVDATIAVCNYDYLYVITIMSLAIH